MMVFLSITHKLIDPHADLGANGLFAYVIVFDEHFLLSELQLHRLGPGQRWPTYERSAVLFISNLNSCL